MDSSGKPSPSVSTGGGVGVMNSNAPMSHASPVLSPCLPSLKIERWSKAVQGSNVFASMAGLSGSNASVGVGPPLLTSVDSTTLKISSTTVNDPKLLSHESSSEI